MAPWFDRAVRQRDTEKGTSAASAFASMAEGPRRLSKAQATAAQVDRIAESPSVEIASQLVANRLALSPGADQTGVPQDPKMMREEALLDLEIAVQLADEAGSGQEKTDDPQPGRVAQRTKDRRAVLVGNVQAHVRHAPIDRAMRHAACPALLRLRSRRGLRHGVLREADRRCRACWSRRISMKNHSCEYGEDSFASEAERSLADADIVEGAALRVRELVRLGPWRPRRAAGCPPARGRRWAPGRARSCCRRSRRIPGTSPSGSGTGR